MTGEELVETLRSFEGRQAGPPEQAADPVNEPMIRHFCEVIGDANPVYADGEVGAAAGHGGVVAPPAMLQAWVMPGAAGRRRREGNAQDELMSLLDEAGYTGVVATDCEQTYHRYLRPGDRLAMTNTIESVSDEKQTRLGPGFFVTTRQRYQDQSGELVGEMVFRVLKYLPAQQRAEGRPSRPRPTVTDDIAFFFEGAKQGRLLIQRCAACGRLRHPPVPMCAGCRSLDRDTVEASGRGTVYSYVVVHHPQVPAFDYPLVVALVELEEGIRLVSNLVGVDPQHVRIGLPVEVEFTAFDEELTLPQFRVVA